MGILGVIGAVLAFFLHDHILIVATSFCGAYASVRAASAFIGGYPNEFEVA